MMAYAAAIVIMFASNQAIPILERMVTEDVSWVHHYEPDTASTPVTRLF